jgi:hypothetical protein
MESDATAMETERVPARAIWRYMDLPRFVSILSTGRLWFAKAATLCDDPWEGYGKAERFQDIMTEGAPKPVVREAAGTTRSITVAQMLADFSRRSAGIFENARDHLYVNSWCLGSSESMAMWQIYGALGSGVAIKSSVEQYRHAARFEVDSTHYSFGEVTYHEALESARDIQGDFRVNIPLPGAGLRSEVLKLGLHKRSCYGYEREWRAVLYQDCRPGIAGVAEAFDLEQLIGAVYVGPRAQTFIVEAVASIMERFLLRKPLERSALLTSPRNEIASAG